MSKVFLIPDHHDFGNVEKRIELTEEMFTWPIYSDLESNETFKLESIYRNVMKAFSNLGVFDCEMSIGVNVEKRYMYSIKRCWGRIYLDNEVVTGFSHYSKEDNHPFYFILEWPEKENLEVVEDWTVEDWETFFIDRINQTALNALLSAASAADEANRVLSQQQLKTRKITEAVNKVKKE